MRKIVLVSAVLSIIGVASLCAGLVLSPTEVNDSENGETRWCSGRSSQTSDSDILYRAETGSTGIVIVRAHYTFDNETGDLCKGVWTYTVPDGVGWCNTVESFTVRDGDEIYVVTVYQIPEVEMVCEWNSVNDEGFSSGNCVCPDVLTDEQKTDPPDPLPPFLR